MGTCAYIFITTGHPKRTLLSIGKIPGVIHADALFGSPDILAIGTGSDIASMDAVIDRIAELPGVAGADSKVARCYFREVPMVGAVDEIIEGIENAKGIPELPISLRKVAVPGTGTDDVANNGTLRNWWILRQMPL